MEEQRRVAAGCPLRDTPSAELQNAGDPGDPGVLPDDLGVGTTAAVQDSAVSRPCRAQFDGHDLTARSDPVAVRRSSAHGVIMRDPLRVVVDGAKLSNNSTPVELREGLRR